ncbi:DUF4406 domain-containing protein [Selenomonas artemidis]|jgi:gp58|uniref:DUF4406 domain-containing protein n=1 Tax=Selenomonas artemidis TaxID=671224 RepID=UPI0023F4F510|nr:DUF4406 domain-containing protein [Selenomonas artemidis]
MDIKDKIVFVSGAITGIENYKEIFAAAEEDLKNQGAIVLNPAVLPWGLKWEDYLRITKEMVRCADVVYVLPKWEQSRGVIEELNLAKKSGKQIIYSGSGENCA